jgi:hypothetical protein
MAKPLSLGKTSLLNLYLLAKPFYLLAKFLPFNKTFLFQTKPLLIGKTLLFSY